MNRPSLLLMPIALAMVGGCERRPDDIPVTVSVIGGEAALRDPSSGPMSSAARVLTGAVRQGLVGFDANGGIEPALAERWIVIDDGRSVIFRLREARWSDGAPVTAKDVAASINRARASRGRNPLAPYLSVIDEAVAMTPQVVEVRLSRSRPDLLNLFAQPELAVVRRGTVGSGPFRIVSRDRRGLRLRPIVDDGGASDDRAPPLAPHDDVLLRSERASAAVIRFATRRSDLVVGGGVDSWPLVPAAAIAPANIRLDPAAGLFGLAVSNRDGFLASAEGRGAVAMAIDRAALTTLFRPEWTPRETVLPDTLDSSAPPAIPGWAAVPFADRLATAQARVARYGEPVRLRIALPSGPGGNLLWNALRSSLGAAGIATERVGEGEAAELRLVDAVAPYDSARWYLRAACQPCAASAAAAIVAARDAPDLVARAARLGEADVALAADTAFIPIAGPLRWSLVAARLGAWSPNARAWHPLNHLRSATK